MTGATRIQADVLVVGGGPAGLSAAHAAAEFGADTVLLDLFARTGGQYHMQPAAARSAFEASTQVEAGRALTRQARSAGARIETGVEVFWAERRKTGFAVYAARGADAVVVEASSLVVATGAMERPIPFKGWTLPGVLGAGAAQRLIKAGSIAPGERTVLAGSGPFLLAVAATFSQAGLPLAAFVEAVRPSAKTLRLLTRHPRRVPEAIRLLQGLRRTGARRYFGWAVQEAIGRERVEAVRIAPVRSDGTFDTSRSRIIENIDCLCLGFGFRPVIDLTALLGADHAFDDAAGGWFCRSHPETGATSIPGLFAAGETTGIAGAIPARLSGRLAGRYATAHARPGQRANPAEATTLAVLQSARSFAKGLAELFPFPSGLHAAIGDDQIVCRCEDVTRGTIAAAIHDGACDVQSVKMWTRAGMGPCQGRICGSAVAELLAIEMGTTATLAGFNQPHLPLRPVWLKTIEAALAGE